MHLIYFNKYQNKEIGKYSFGSQISVEAWKNWKKKKAANLKAYKRMNHLLLLERNKIYPTKNTESLSH